MLPSLISSVFASTVIFLDERETSTFLPVPITTSRVTGATSFAFSVLVDTSFPFSKVFVVISS